MRQFLFLCLLGGAPISAFAELHALSQADLRVAVSEERALGGKAIIAQMSEVETHDVLDLRVFEVADALVYRIIYRGAGDDVSSAMINAMTGEEITAFSPLGLAIWGCDKTKLPTIGEDGTLVIE